MRTALYGILAAAVWAAACGGGSSPTQPSASTEVVNSVSVNGRSMAESETQQFTAQAELPDGTTKDVSALAKWSSSDPTVASVSPTGLVTGLKEGSTNIKAQYSNKSGQKNTSIRALKVGTLAGAIDDAPPAFKSLGGVLVQVMDGPNEGQATTTDGNGYYTFVLHQGSFTVSYSLDGYITVTKSVALQDLSKRVDLLMYPVPPPGATARCKNKSWSFALDRGSSCTRTGGVSYWVCPGPLCQ
jgi:hypothetical protein